MEKVDGQAAGISDLEGCRAVLRQVNASRVFHGNVNRYKFVVGEREVTVVNLDAGC